MLTEVNSSRLFLVFICWSQFPMLRVCGGGKKIRRACGGVTLVENFAGCNNVHTRCGWLRDLSGGALPGPPVLQAADLTS